MGTVLDQPALWLLALFLFLYVASEVGVWNWLTRHLIAQGIPESRALNILSLGFALGLLIGRVAVSPVLVSVSALTGYVGGFGRDGDDYLSYAADQRSEDRRDSGLSGRRLDGAGVSDHARDRRRSFPRMTGTALGIVITFGWIGLAVSSRIIGSIAGGRSAPLEEGAAVAAGDGGGDDLGESHAACRCSGAMTQDEIPLPLVAAR